MARIDDLDPEVGGPLRTAEEWGNALIVLGITSATAAAVISATQPKASFTRTVASSLTIGFATMLAEQAYHAYRARKTNAVKAAPGKVVLKPASAVGLQRRVSDLRTRADRLLLVQQR